MHDSEIDAPRRHVIEQGQHRFESPVPSHMHVFEIGRRNPYMRSGRQHMLLDDDVVQRASGKQLKLRFRAICR